jgi:hypothetical protein
VLPYSDPSLVQGDFYSSYYFFPLQFRRLQNVVVPTSLICRERFENVGNMEYSSADVKKMAEMSVSKQ